MSKRSRFRLVFVVVTGPCPIAGSDYFNTRLLPHREAKPMPRARERDEPFRFPDMINGCRAFNFNSVGAREPSFFDLTTSPEAASCRACRVIGKAVWIP